MSTFIRLSRWLFFFFPHKVQDVEEKKATNVKFRRLYQGSDNFLKKIYIPFTFLVSVILEENIIKLCILIRIFFCAVALRSNSEKEILLVHLKGERTKVVSFVKGICIVCE